MNVDMTISIDSETGVKPETVLNIFVRAFIQSRGIPSEIMLQNSEKEDLLQGQN